jgi:hypothetical protein
MTADQMDYYMFHLFIISNIFVQLLFLILLKKLINNKYTNLKLIKIEIYLSWLCCIIMSLEIFRIYYINYSKNYRSIKFMWSAIHILLIVLSANYLFKYIKEKKEMDNKLYRAKSK